MRILTWSRLGLVACLCLLPGLAFADPGAGSRCDLESLRAAQRDYWPWFVGATNRQVVGDEFLMPQPDGPAVSTDPYITQGSMQVTVPTGKTLVLPMAAVLGERYNDGTPDDRPADYPIDYRASQLRLTIDGHVLIDSAHQSLACFDFGTVWLRKPAVYPSPSSYGSVAALWVKGLGVLLRPLARGAHVIELQVVSPTAVVWGVDYGYYNTWYVTVSGH